MSRLVSCDCSEGGCDKKTTINLGWCSEHLHMRKKITTGMSLQGANAGYGQFATATEHSKVGFTSVVFCETAVVLVFDELMEYTSHAERKKRYGFNVDGTYSTGTYAAAREVRAKTGEGFLPHENWDESRRDGLEVHAIYMDGARTRNPASLINRPSEGRTANVAFCQAELKKGRYVLVAIRDILDGEELLWNYGSMYEIGKGMGHTSEYELLGADAIAYRERWLRSGLTEAGSSENSISVALRANVTVRSNESRSNKKRTEAATSKAVLKAVLAEKKSSFFTPRTKTAVAGSIPLKTTLAEQLEQAINPLKTTTATTGLSTGTAAAPANSSVEDHAAASTSTSATTEPSTTTPATTTTTSTTTSSTTTRTASTTRPVTTTGIIPLMTTSVGQLVQEKEDINDNKDDTNRQQRSSAAGEGAIGVDSMVQSGDTP